MTTRRDFLGKTVRGLGLMTAGSSLSAIDGLLCASARAAGVNETVLTVLNTNDVHSRFESFPEGNGRNAGLAGASRRATLIRRIRQEAEVAGYPQPLLVDGGDLFQGTPYFNLFKGELDYKIVKALGYDAMTVGNHDFDIGLDGLLHAMEAAGIGDSFSLLSANYDFSGTILKDHVRPYIIRQRGPVKVGIFGLGVRIQGLVAPDLCQGVIYNDPLEVAKSVSNHLRLEENCDLVVCLSHLGNRSHGDDPGDQTVAKATDNIDLIIGGHSHTFMREPERFQHSKRETLVFQVGFGGLYLGRVDFQMKAGEVVAAFAAALPVEAQEPELMPSLG